jgi:hypothetical protein
MDPADLGNRIDPPMLLRRTDFRYRPSEKQAWFAFLQFVCWLPPRFGENSA